MAPWTGFTWVQATIAALPGAAVQEPGFLPLQAMHRGFTPCAEGRR